jgi:hypothetical protein
VSAALMITVGRGRKISESSIPLTGPKIKTLRCFGDAQWRDFSCAKGVREHRSNTQ